MKKVYVVHYHGPEYGLTVSLDGKSVPMDEFVQMHTPIQVTPLTLLSPSAKAQTFIGLLIAEEVAAGEESAPDKKAPREIKATW